MFLQPLTFQLVRSLPWAGCSRPWRVSGVLGSHACRPPYTLQPTGQSKAVSLPGKGAQLELEELLVPRKMAISPLESWLTARYLLPRLDAGVPVSAAPTQPFQCPPSQVEGEEWNYDICR
uniref:Uncharacterized protein n=1 Tax=Sciurus vulgaris TaxID=55149 RepID=A0A8D2JMA3_SCIVU